MDYFDPLGGAFWTVVGVAIALYALRLWRQEGFGDLDPFVMMRLIIPSALAMTLGVQIGLSSLFLSLLKLYWRQSIILIDDFERAAPHPAPTDA